MLFFINKIVLEPKGSLMNVFPDQRLAKYPVDTRKWLEGCYQNTVDDKAAIQNLSADFDKGFMCTEFGRNFRKSHYITNNCCMYYLYTKS